MFKSVNNFYKSIFHKEDIINSLLDLSEQQLNTYLKDDKGIDALIFFDSKSRRYKEYIASQNTNIKQVLRSCAQTFKMEKQIIFNINPERTLEEIVVTLGDNMYFFCTLQNYNNIYIYLAVDLTETNLALARAQMDTIVSIIDK